MIAPRFETQPAENPVRALSAVVAVRDPGLRAVIGEQLRGCCIGALPVDDGVPFPRNMKDCAADALFVECGPEDGESLNLIGETRKKGYGGVIIAVTAGRDPAFARSLLRAGADHILHVGAEEMEYDIIAGKIEYGRARENTLHEMLEKFFEPVEQGVILFDGKMEFVFANRSARSILTVREDVQIGRMIKSNCPESIFAKSALNGSAITYADVTLPDGETRRMLGLEVCCFRAAQEGPLYMILIHDFSTYRKLDELRSRFATSLSHRMRTPLTSIRNAVKLLGENEQPLGTPEKERLIDIGWRNVEKLISNLDELQKIFMIESEELNVCRTMVRVKMEIRTIFEQFVGENKISGYKLSVPDIMVFTGSGRLRDFFVSAIDAYDVWLSGLPFIECSTSLKEEYDFYGEINRKLVIYLRPRTTSWLKTSRESLKDFLSCNEAHRGLVLGRLAAALEGELQISPGNTISLSIPLEPQFSREKDLVHPLHMMMERADITGAGFNLVTLSMNGEVENGSKFGNMIEKVLCQQLGGDAVVSRGESPMCYSLFINNRSAEEVDTLIRSIRENFLKSCHLSGEEVHPSIHWDIKYSRAPGVNESPIESILAVDVT